MFWWQVCCPTALGLQTVQYTARCSRAAAQHAHRLGQPKTQMNADKILDASCADGDVKAFSPAVDATAVEEPRPAAALQPFPAAHATAVVAVASPASAAQTPAGATIAAGARQQEACTSQGQLGAIAGWRLGWRRTCHTMAQALGLRRLQDYIQASLNPAGYTQ